MSRGLALTPCSPVCPAKLVPAFGLISPPPTHIQPNRSSLIQDVLKTWLQVAERLSVWVRRLYPNAGNSASFSAADPKGMEFVGVENRPANEHAVAGAEGMVDPGVVLVDVRRGEGRFVQIVAARSGPGSAREFSPAWRLRRGRSSGSYRSRIWRSCRRIVDRNARSREVAGRVPERSER